MLRREAFMIDGTGAPKGTREAQIRNWRKSGEKRGWELAKAYIVLAIDRYSRGQELAEVSRALHQAADALRQARESGDPAPDLQEKENYHLAMDSMCLMVLLRWDADQADQYLQDIAATETDRFFSHLFGYEKDDFPPPPAPYGHLLRALTGPEAAVVPEIQQFLTGYYAGLEGLPWYESHRKHGADFFGYWSFALALVILARGGRDHEFADNVYYPRDLVYGKLFRTWYDGPEGEADRELLGKMHAPEGITEALVEQLKEFFQTSMREGKVSSTQEVELMSSLNLMGNVLGITPQALQNSPALGRKVVLQLLRIIVETSDEVIAIGQGKQPVPEEVQQFVDRIRPEDVAELGLLPEEIPQEILDHFRAETPQAAVDRITAQLQGFNTSVKQLLEEERIDLMELKRGLVKLDQDFAALFEKEDDVIQQIREEVRRELDEKFRKFRE
ncbi:MAG: PoNe immunity protein domain-containing protein [Bacteroidota bacterium]